jgi:hypothetical protein
MGYNKRLAISALKRIRCIQRCLRIGASFVTQILAVEKLQYV